MANKSSKSKTPKAKSKIDSVVDLNASIEGVEKMLRDAVGKHEETVKAANAQFQTMIEQTQEFMNKLHAPAPKPKKPKKIVLEGDQVELFIAALDRLGELFETVVKVK